MSSIRPALDREGAFAGQDVACVLGTRALAHSICQALEGAGFAARLLSEDPAAIRDLDGLKRALKEFHAQGGTHVHPGNSLWGERAELFQLCKEFGLNPIAPPLRVISRFTNKLNLIAEAERLGILTLALGTDLLASSWEVEQRIRSMPHPYPIVLKSVRGGAGVGICVLHSDADLEPRGRMALWMEQLRRCFGEAVVFIERYLSEARHLVIPFARGRRSKVRIFPSIDVSLQSRHRKMVEFCPAGLIDASVLSAAEAAVRKLAEDVDFFGVGSFEFLVDSKRAYFLDGSARLNTGFPLWESVAGTSAIEWQLSTLLGYPQPEFKPNRNWSQAVALRVYAEDPLRQLPRPGKIHEITPPREWKMPGGVARWILGDSVSEDGIIGMLFAGAAGTPGKLDMAGVLGSAQHALEDLWICGEIQTNERALRELIAHPWVKAGIFHAGFLEEEFVPQIAPPENVAQAMIRACRETLNDQGPPLKWRVGGRAITVKEVQSSAKACAFPIGERLWMVRVGGWSEVVKATLASDEETLAKSRVRELKALVSGRVHSILVQEGAIAVAGEELVRLDSMKLLVPHRLSRSVRVKRWWVESDQEIRLGETLAEIELVETPAKGQNFPHA